MSGDSQEIIFECNRNQNGNENRSRLYSKDFRRVPYHFVQSLGYPIPIKLTGSHHYRFIEIYFIKKSQGFDSFFV